MVNQYTTVKGEKRVYVGLNLNPRLYKKLQAAAIELDMPIKVLARQIIRKWLMGDCDIEIGKSA